MSITKSLPALLKQIRAIRHTAGANLEDDAYRAILKRCANVSSSTEIKRAADAKAVLDEFARLGVGQPARRPLSPMQKMMWSLWQQLADRGAVKNRKMDGLLAYIERQTGVEAKGSLAWMTWPQEHSVVESLKSWLARVQKEAEHG